MQTLEVIRHYYQAYFGSSGLGVVFCAAVIWLLLAGAGKEEKNGPGSGPGSRSGTRERGRQRQFLLPCVIIAVVTVFPLSAWVIARAIGQDVYWRVFWMVPAAAAAAFLLTELTERVSPGIRRLGAAAGLCVLLALNGNLVFGNAFFTARSNTFKLPGQVLEMADMINSHAADSAVDVKKVVVPEEIAVYLRLYDPSFRQAYGRGTMKNEDRQKELYLLVNADEPDYHSLVSLLRYYHYKYLVLRKSADDRAAMEEAGFECLGEVSAQEQTYVVYFDADWYDFLEKRKAKKENAADGGAEADEEEDSGAQAQMPQEQAEAAAVPQAAEAAGAEGSAAPAQEGDAVPAREAVVTTGAMPGPDSEGWTVTQYGPRDINSMFYTIYHPREGLIVVDGGWREDADYVRSVIDALGGKVDAWILTHPHPDHCGAFNAIWEGGNAPPIGKVYAVEMASPAECLSVASWDSTECLEDFLALDIPQLTYVHRGDELTICGLSFRILNAFDDVVRSVSRDYLNDGSMMFRVTGPERSMLFCADVGKSMSAVLYQEYKDLLPSDYVQMGHHGNGGLKKKFYRKVKPSTAFFDAPDWLMEDQEGQYGTPVKIALMEGLGSRIVSFNSAPNSVPL